MNVDFNFCMLYLTYDERHEMKNNKKIVNKERLKMRKLKVVIFGELKRRIPNFFIFGSLKLLRCIMEVERAKKSFIMGKNENKKVK